MIRHSPLLTVAVFVAFLAAVPFAAPPFWVTLGNYIGLYSIVALGLVLHFISCSASRRCITCVCLTV